MKKAFQHIVPLDRLRGRLTKKKVISLLIFMTIAIALFVAPMAAFASSNARNGSSQSQTATVTPTDPGGVSKPIAQLTAIRMLDKTQGWALTQSSILKTTDGGLRWQDVTPANAKFNPKFMPIGDFLNAQNAWVVTPQGDQKSVSLLRTTDGGKSWQSSTIQVPEIVSEATLHFLSASAGWLEVRGQMGPEGRPLFIFQTTDGGQHWKQLGSPNTKSISNSTGVSFSDMQTGWETGDNPTAAMSGAINNTQPLLEVTRDGGKTWRSQLLPVLPGGGKSDMVSTSPPVFFGKNGLLPVIDQIVPPSGGASKPGIGLNLYVTQNGGQTWTPTKLVTLKNNGPLTFYIADIQHAWAASGINLYVTSNGGQSWTQLPPTPQPIDALNFIDANNGWAISSTNAASPPNPARPTSTASTPNPAAGVSSLINAASPPNPAAGAGSSTNAASPTDGAAGNANNQQPKLLRTINGGRAWQQINYAIAGKPKATPTAVGGAKRCGNLFYQQEAENAEITLTSWTNRSAQENVNCFLQAFQQCTPAAIGFVVNIGKASASTPIAPQIFSAKSQLAGGGSTKNYTFSTKSQSGSCAIAESVSINMVPKTQETCARVEKTGTDIRFLNCGKAGTLTFPLTIPGSSGNSGSL